MKDRRCKSQSRKLKETERLTEKAGRAVIDVMAFYPSGILSVLRAKGGMRYQHC